MKLQNESEEPKKEGPTGWQFIVPVDQEELLKDVPPPWNRPFLIGNDRAIHEAVIEFWDRERQRLDESRTSYSEPDFKA